MGDNWIQIESKLIKIYQDYHNWYLINKCFINFIPSSPFNDFIEVLLEQCRAAYFLSPSTPSHFFYSNRFIKSF